MYEIDVGERFARRVAPSFGITAIPTTYRSVPSIPEPIKTPTASIPTTKLEPITVTQPPDYTPYATGAPKPGLISQDGLGKRLKDIIAAKKLISLKEKGEVPKTFDRVIGHEVPKGFDYTDFPSGAPKPGLISQDGLAKRIADINSQKNTIAKIETKGNPVAVARVSSEGGFLFWVDKFFIWVNRVIGE